MTTVRTPRPETVAAVKSAVVSRLIEALVDLDGTLKDSLPAGSFAVRLQAPANVGSTVQFNNGSKGMTLRFFSHQGMDAVLSGGKAPVLPLPGSFAAGKALKAFSTAAAGVSKAMAHVPETDDEAGIRKKTKLLITAALAGVCEVYNYDHWVSLKSASIPEGTIAVRVKGEDDLSGTIILKDKKMIFDPQKKVADPNAVLEFADTAVCYGVLTGSLAAMGELGSGRVMVKGRLPLIQGLFPLLDRFGEIMK